MSVDISVSITEDKVDIIATPTVNIVNVTNSASIDPSLYDLSEFTNTSPNPFVRTSGLSSYVPTSRTLTINGTTQDLSADRTFTISTGITIGTTAITSGTVGRVLFQGTGNVVQESANLFWDETNGRLGIGTSTPNSALQVVGTTNTTYLQTSLIFSSGGDTLTLATQGGTSAITVFPTTRNVLIQNGGTHTDAGFKLDVNGTARVQGNVEIGGASATTVYSTYNSTTRNQIKYTNVSSFEFHEGVNERMRIAAGGNVGIGTSSPSYPLHITRNSSSNYIQLSGNSNKGLFAEGSGLIAFDTSGNFNVYTGGVNLRATISSGGNVLINTTTDAGFRLDVNGTARVSQDLTLVAGNAIRFGTSLGMSKTANQMLIYGGTGAGNAGGTDVHYWNGSTYVVGLRLNNNANVLIGTTTDGGSKLRVVGLPTSSAGLSSGDVWNNLGILTIV